MSVVDVGVSKTSVVMPIHSALVTLTKIVVSCDLYIRKSSSDDSYEVVLRNSPWKSLTYCGQVFNEAVVHITPTHTVWKVNL
jgi:hypothetical protein